VKKYLFTIINFTKEAEYDNQRYKILKINPNDNILIWLLQNIADFVYSFSLRGN